MKYAFSLVELSIVLVILGLLTGGILTGQNLIRAAEIRSVATEYQKYQTATYTFRDKYFALPGDMTNATEFWGAEPAANCPGDETTPSTGTATCSGDGDGEINWGNGVAAGVGGETHRYWQHLANAGLIEGTYTGTHGGGTCNTDGSCVIIVGLNAPQSKLGTAGWSIAYGGNQTYYYQSSQRNKYFFGAQANNSWNLNAVLKPEEAWNIDTKIDDGLPGTGFAQAYTSSVRPNCTTTDDAADATYDFSNDSITCALVFSAD